ncbi:phage protease [Rhizobium sp. SL86]|uniref:phage protease n=1 Tax=Rhizobium sp. SL86 TaxID=2995148 RepID=UPI002274CBD8|nr:phage protease [Rhizobium sp. SL86]MCY1667860.1 hypothetical protein [Rhizobium sp. SL86]
MQTAINSFLLPMGVDEAEQGPPEWVHLIPAGVFSGSDGRGPYEVTSPAGVIAASILPGRKLPIDINHAIDHLAPEGKPTPAVAWIVALEAREDGIWGNVEWTPEGRWIWISKSYGYLSPVFVHTKDAPHQVIRLLRAAVTNNPNLTLTALHNHSQEAVMLEQLRKALGLPETATEAEVLAAVASAHQAQQERSAHTALIGKIVEAVDLPTGTSGDALVTALQSRGKVTAAEAENAELKTTVTSLQSQLTTLISTHARDKAVSVVEEAVKAGKIVPALKDHMIARHMKDPAEVEKEIALLPSINAGGLGGHREPEAGAALSAEDKQIAAMMGIDEKTFADRSKALHGKDL